MQKTYFFVHSKLYHRKGIDASDVQDQVLHFLLYVKNTWKAIVLSLLFTILLLYCLTRGEREGGSFGTRN